MVAAMPIFAEEELERRNPPHVAGAVSPGRDPGLSMANTVYDAGRVEHKHKPNRAEPEERGWAEQSPTEEGR